MHCEKAYKFNILQIKATTIYEKTISSTQHDKANYYS